MSQPPTQASPGGDCRCVCGSLVARLVADGVELKCRRCKRTLLVPLSGEATPASRGAPTRPVHPLSRTG